ELHNFSAGGMMLRSNFAIRPGEIIRVRLDKPLYTSASKLMNSKVVWCRDLNDQDDTVTRFGIGVSLE
ncbi:MAG: PilZ domain-containing protein, partial [Nitrospirae bacterium]|nr:PilZ domain-containing protein [Nitrospirota bacterium]